jgi:hypothetical protein
MLNTATPTWQRDFVADRVDATRQLHIWCLATNHNLDIEDEPSASNQVVNVAIFLIKISGIWRDPESVSRIFALQQRSALAMPLCGLSAAQFKALTGVQ